MVLSCIMKSTQMSVELSFLHEIHSASARIHALLVSIISGASAMYKWEQQSVKPATGRACVSWEWAQKVTVALRTTGVEYDT